MLAVINFINGKMKMLSFPVIPTLLEYLSGNLSRVFGVLREAAPDVRTKVGERAKTVSLPL